MSPLSRRHLAGLVVAVALAGLALAAPWAASAQQYPARAVNLIVMAPAGGPTDVAARILAGIAEKSLGQPIVIVNKVGAGGQVGWTELARSKPDGYTIGFLIMPGTNTVILDPERQAIFDESSFVLVVNHVLDPGTIWVRADSPYKTFQDVIDAAKKAPGTIRAATTGILSDDHLNILITEEATGAKFRIVHLEGAANQLKETLGGNIDVSFDNVGSVVKPMKAGQIRVLAVTDPERSKFLPDIPTTKELGFPAIVSSSTRGIAAPKGTPPAIVAKLAEVLKKAMEDPEHIKRLDEQGLGIRAMVGAEFESYWKDQHERARKYTDWAKKRPQ
jgi:tripartite-type tricarboxylate transporter receptor subunit TctC